LLTFKPAYFIIAVIIFAVEVLIALYLQDPIIRPYVGDLLVVILIYCFIKSFFSFPVATTAAFVLLFAYFIEWLQYMNLVKVLSLENSKLANVILGNRFEWIDMLAYTLGIGIVLIFEKAVRKRKV